jgi:hypothetical protein
MEVVAGLQLALVPPGGASFDKRFDDGSRLPWVAGRTASKDDLERTVVGGATVAEDIAD